MNASFTLPMKYARDWAWENTWLVWTVFALVLLPPWSLLQPVPNLGEVYRSTAANVVFEVIGFGAGWGVAQVFFGLAVDAIGIALTFSLVLGTSAAVGTLIPLLRLHRERLNTPAGHGVLAGVAIVIAGVVACAVAGRLRENALKLDAGRRKNAISAGAGNFCGFGASFVNFGLAFGTPLCNRSSRIRRQCDERLKCGVDAADARRRRCRIFSIVSGFSKRTGLAGKFPAGGASHGALAFVMAVCWFGSTLLYGVSTVMLGEWGPIVGWPLFMSLIVITASLLGMLTGEWKNSGGTPLRMQWIGVALLVFAVFILAVTSRAVE